jgi:hypothetical protein
LEGIWEAESKLEKRSGFDQKWNRSQWAFHGFVQSLFNFVSELNQPDMVQKRFSHWNWSIDHWEILFKVNFWTLLCKWLRLRSIDSQIQWNLSQNRMKTIIFLTNVNDENAFIMLWNRNFNIRH